MIDKLNSEIEEINSNLSILPTKTKNNAKKYYDYINECLSKYEPMLEENINEINSRKNEFISKYNNIPLTQEVKIDYNSLKLSDPRCPSNEKLNLNYLLYNLNNSTNNSLEEINKILLEIIHNFKEAGINLTERDFTHSEAVNQYMNTLLNATSDIQKVFNEIFFKTPNLLSQITLNVWYLYYKYKSKIDDYFKKKYLNFDFHNYINFYRDSLKNNEYEKHNNKKYLYDLFMSGTFEINEFLDEKKIGDLKNSILTNPDSDRNYINLYNYRNSLIEFKGYKEYKYIIDDFKELFAHKEEYKDLFNNKYKEIVKEEKKLFSLNKKISKKGLFKLKNDKLANAKLEVSKTIDNLINLYKELNDISIKDIIKKHFTLESNYYDALKLVTYSLDHFISLLESQEIPINKQSIDDNLYKLQKYIYDCNIDVIDNVVLSEEKDIAKIISDMYKLNGIITNDEILNGEEIDNVIQNVDKLIIHYDIINADVNLNDIKFILDVDKQLTNK